MKTKIVTLVAASMLLTGTLNASEKFISVGFALRCTKSNLSYQSLSYDADVIDASVSYSF